MPKSYKTLIIIMSDTLSPRFKYDEDKIPENPVKRDVVTSIQNKIENGQYKFTKVKCPICNSARFRSLAQQDRDGIWHPLVICRDCGLIQTNPRLTEKSYENFYENEYRLLNEGRDRWQSDRFASQREKAVNLYRLLSTEIPDKLEGAKVLDVGTGPGGSLNYFQEKGHEVIGCDLDPDAVSYATEKGIPVEHGTFAEVDLYWEPDIVILSHVVEHFTDPVAELNQLREVIHSDAIIYVEVPGVKELSLTNDWYNGDFQQQLQTAHTYYFTVKSLQNLMGVVGFASVYTDEYVHGIFEPTNECTQIGIESDYDDVIGHLKSLEWGRRFRLHLLANPKRVINWAYRKVKSLMSG